MKYEPYRGCAFASRKLGSKDVVQTLIDASSICVKAEQDNDRATLALEMVHYGLSHQVISVSKNLAERLLNTRMELQLDNLYIPYNVFEICWEEGLLVPGTQFQLPGCLVVARPDGTVLSAIEQFNRRVLVAAGLDPSLSGVDPKLSDMLITKYRDPLGKPGYLESPICHCNISYTKDRGKSVEEIIYNLPRGNLPVGMDDVDKHIQVHVLRGILALVAYMNTGDPDLRPFKFYDRPRMGIAPKAQLVGGKFERCPPGWHLRRAHMRYLRDPRFKRDGQGNVRVIWVQGAEVGSGRQPSAQTKEVEVTNE